MIPFTILLLIILIIAVLFWNIAAKSQTPKRRPIIAHPSMPYEEISFTSQASNLIGWFIPAPSGTTMTPHLNQPVIIIAHGWNSNRSRVLRYAEPLHQAGYALLLYDARSHGESEGIPAPSGMAFRDDVMAAIDYVSSRHDVDATRIGVLGHSLGGFGSTAALKVEQRIKALVTDSMPVRMDTMVGAELTRKRIPKFPLAMIIPRVWFIRSGINKQKLRDFDLIHVLTHRSTPVLHIHSKQDNYIPSTELDFILTHKLPNLEHLYVQSKGHSCSETDPLFWNNVIPFFHKHLQT